MRHHLTHDPSVRDSSPQRTRTRTPDPIRRTRLAAAIAAPAALALLAGCAAAAPADASPGTEGSASRASTSQSTTGAPHADIAVDLSALEQQYDARVGVVAIDTGTGRTASWHGDDRFAYASTLKALAAGLVLQREGVAALDDPVAIPAAPLIDYSPVTEQHAGGTMTLGEVAAAAVELSDNTAGNLLFARLGGVDALQKQLRGLGDRTTQVDRIEPDLNEAAPGDERDTSTPRALASSLRALAVDEGRKAPLDSVERAALNGWLDGSQTGATLIRAGLPDGWTAGDKSGAAGYGTRNDVAVVHPPSGAPIVIAVLSSRDATGDPDAEYDDALVAAAARATLDALRA
ncbi:class A beta-lactamase [Schumannella sp. 10F1B-5-1]|uniref:class A beta-lactamase n=1 Tax=Schumannella sp. 10F1B-5-1 TaxID=2590780 RepID=UPI001130A16D|nr:class A beta-lactamase [Schumannella sp. 10F1B-5-1]TPW76879.1 class A beta-lactamase [Schumannella sp. 10F1B-5-1]